MPSGLAIYVVKKNSDGNFQRIFESKMIITEAEGRVEQREEHTNFTWE
jgi:hypothetical protein